jgi:hypothetical protein
MKLENNPYSFETNELPLTNLSIVKENTGDEITSSGFYSNAIQPTQLTAGRQSEYSC